MNDKNFVTHPSKNVLVVFTILQIVGIGLMFFGLFNEDGSFDRPNIMIQILIAMGIWTLIKLYLNYFKNTKRE